MTRKEQADTRTARQNERQGRFCEALRLAMLGWYDTSETRIFRNWVQIAALVGVSVRTLSRWRTSPTWQKAEQEALAAFHRRLKRQQDLQRKALDARMIEHDKRVHEARQKAGRARWGR